MNIVYDKKYWKIHFFSSGGPLSHRLWPLLRPEVVTILLRGYLTGGHRYPLWRDGEFYSHALPGIRTWYLWRSNWLPYPLHQLVGIFLISNTERIECTEGSCPPGAVKIHISVIMTATIKIFMLIMWIYRKRCLLKAVSVMHWNIVPIWFPLFPNQDILVDMQGWRKILPNLCDGCSNDK